MPSASPASLSAERGFKKPTRQNAQPLETAFIFSFPFLALDTFTLLRHSYQWPAIFRMATKVWRVVKVLVVLPA